MKKIFTRLFWIGIAVALLLSAAGCRDNDVDEPIDNTGDQGGYEDPIEGEQPNDNDTPNQGDSQQGGSEPDVDEPQNPDDSSSQQPNTDKPDNNEPDGNDEPNDNTQGDDEPEQKPDNDEPEKEDPKEDDPVVRNPYPWENGGKAPSQYTWEEFLALSAEYKVAFISSFKNTDDYTAWLTKANAEAQPKSDLPWENGGKQPSQYTWAEFMALSDAHKAAFVASFTQPSDYQKWLASVQGQSGTTPDPTPSTPSTPSVTPTEKMPWEKPGGKRPSEYTWAEYQALTPEQKAAFFKAFSNPADFQVWMDEALGLNTPGSNPPPSPGVIPPWTTGGKQPSQYTWEEYEALTPALKVAFRNSFKTQEAYDQWYNMVQGSAPLMPWENGGKLPSEYTWAEFEALSDDVQEAFYEWFGSNDAFIAWKDRVQGNSGSGSNTPTLPWENGGKLPNQYTWAEFEALSDELQEYFQDWFPSFEAFEAWMNSVQGNSGSSGNIPESPSTPALPWENGGKLPNQYTWAEFEALSDELQEYFQDWFPSFEAFEAWMNSVRGGSGNTPTLPWENGGKLPNQYTWAEFEALSDELQECFQDWFPSFEAFEVWMNSVRGGSGNTPTLPWENGGKLPNQYTWAEFEALSDELKDHFQDWFYSNNVSFADWMDSVRS